MVVVGMIVLLVILMMGVAAYLGRTADTRDRWDDRLHRPSLLS